MRQVVYTERGRFIPNSDRRHEIDLIRSHIAPQYHKNGRARVLPSIGNRTVSLYHTNLSTVLQTSGLKVPLVELSPRQLACVDVYRFSGLKVPSVRLYFHITPHVIRSTDSKVWKYRRTDPASWISLSSTAYLCVVVAIEVLQLHHAYLTIPRHMAWENTPRLAQNSPRSLTAKSQPEWRHQKVASIQHDKARIIYGSLFTTTDSGQMETFDNSVRSALFMSEIFKPVCKNPAGFIMSYLSALVACPISLNPSSPPDSDQRVTIIKSSSISPCHVWFTQPFVRSSFNNIHLRAGIFVENVTGLSDTSWLGLNPVLHFLRRFDGVSRL